MLPLMPPSETICGLKEKTRLDIIVSVYTVYLVLAIVSFYLIATNELRVFTLVTPAASSAMHLFFLAFNPDRYPYKKCLYKSVDIVLFIGVVCTSIYLITCSIDTGEIHHLVCSEDHKSTYYALSISLNTMTCVSVVLCVIKTCVLRKPRNVEYSDAISFRRVPNQIQDMTL